LLKPSRAVANDDAGDDDLGDGDVDAGADVDVGGNGVFIGVFSGTKPSTPVEPLAVFSMALNSASE
jgi:hypothetical protein